MDDPWNPEVYDTFSAEREALVGELGDHSPYLFTFTRLLMWGGDRRP